jgi:hypothetical protein
VADLRSIEVISLADVAALDARQFGILVNWAASSVVHGAGRCLDCRGAIGSGPVAFPGLLLVISDPTTGDTMIAVVCKGCTSEEDLQSRVEAALRRDFTNFQLLDRARISAPGRA